MDVGTVIHGFGFESEYQEALSPHLRPIILLVYRLCLISNDEGDF